MMYGNKWFARCNGKTLCNHFVTGSRPYSFAAWKTWNTILKTAYEADAND